MSSKKYEYYTELLETEYYPFLISKGIRVDDFWSMTILEMDRLVKFYHDEELNRLRLDANIAYRTAGMVGQAFGGKLKPFDTYFPNLMDKENANEDAKIKRTMINLANKNKK